MIGVNEKKINEMALDISKGKSILLIDGDYGSGKTLVAEKIEKALPSNVKVERWMFSVDLANQIRSITMTEALEEERPSPKTVVIFIDRFELSDVMADKDIIKVLELMTEITKSGAGFVLSITPKAVMRLFEMSDRFKNISKIYKINPMTYPETKQLIVSRLNEIRIKKSDDLEPFTENEVKDIWKKSQGNPRMVLLILANLYDIRTQS
jgi:type II secretory pathway predicted ATPase ExeA